LRSRPRRRASAARHTSRGGDTPRWAAGAWARRDCGAAPSAVG